MTTALIFPPIFVGLSAALTVIVADLLSPKTKTGATAAEVTENRRATA